MMSKSVFFGALVVVSGCSSGAHGDGQKDAPLGTQAEAQSPRAEAQSPREEGRHAYLYWSDYNRDTIGRARLDGADVNPTFITLASTSTEGTGPTGVAIHGRYIYWASTYPNGAIGRANLDGSDVNQSFITFPSLSLFPTVNTIGLAVDDAHVYWTEFSTQFDSSGEPLFGYSVGRANLDGSGANQTFITLVPGVEPPEFTYFLPGQVILDGRYVYWAFGQWIGRADRDGSDVNQYFLATGDLPVWGVAVQGRRLYFSGAGDIGRANLDGSALNAILIADGTHNVATYGNHIYWTDFLPFSEVPTSTIARADLDGSKVDLSFIPGPSGPFDAGLPPPQPWGLAIEGE